MDEKNIDPLDGHLEDDADLGPATADDDEDDIEDDVEQALPGGAEGAAADGGAPAP